VGFDNIFGADFCNPPLTTLAERTQDAGARAVEALVQQIRHPTSDSATRLLATQLIVRASTGVSVRG
jgi:LacI family transcriptional regulator